MKRFGYLYEKIYDLDNIIEAHSNARKGKKHYTEVRMVDKDVYRYAKQIQEMLVMKTFVNGEYEIFTKIDKGKEREIYKLPYFPDRIVHHAIMQVMQPIWKSTLIADTYQSVKGRGIHKAKQRVEKAVRNPDNKYCLKLDIRKFYPSTNNTVLKRVIRKKIKCADTLWLLDTIIESTDGLPIGNYLSQYLGNIVLSDIDHLMKERYKLRYYFRYCDDMVIIHNDKKYLHEVLSVMRTELSKLGLSIKNDYQVFPIDKRSPDFIGFVFGRRNTKIRKSITKGMFESGKKGNLTSLPSYFGWVKTTNSKGLWDVVIKGANIPRLDKLRLRGLYDKY